MRSFVVWSVVALFGISGCGTTALPNPSVSPAETQAVTRAVQPTDPTAVHTLTPEPEKPAAADADPASDSGEPAPTAPPAFNVATPAAAHLQNDFAIQLRARQFTPEAGVEEALQARLQQLAKGESLYVLMQFWELPGAEARARLEANGVILFDYVPNNAWFVELPGRLEWTSIQAVPIRWVGSLRPADRLEPGLLDAAATADRVRLQVRFFPTVSAERARQLFEQYGAGVVESAPDFNRYVVELDPQVVANLAAENAVQWIMQAPVPQVPDAESP